MGFLSVLSCAHRWTSERARPGDIVIDATVGTGADTAFLCRTVGPNGTVYGFDIQQDALDRASARIQADAATADVSLHLILRSHAAMAAAIPTMHHGRVAAVMFNLGYLPGGDHHVVTRPESTIPALEAALSLLRPGGIVTIVLYPGHPGGQEEADQVEQWAAAQPEARYQTILYRFTNRTSSKPPYLIAMEKKNQVQRTPV